MATWVWVVIAIVVVAVIALVAVGARNRRTAMLRDRFGPEYDRVIENSDDQRAAEADLRGRERRRAQFDVKPLPEAGRLRFANEWRELQERFVDQPAPAAAAADALVVRVMEARGYPVREFDAQAELVSVDYPDTVENYRFAHGVQQRSQTEQASTEELREALLRYRSLFGELLRPDATETAATGTGPAGSTERTPEPAGDDTGTAATESTEEAAVPMPDTGASETGDPAYRDQPARGGRP
ncbi:MAG TPA: hypothetical protein VGM53_05070 [Streptosporangiaceae bacterium]